MNILKPSELIEKGDYQKIFYHFDFASVWAELLSKKNYRFFKVEKKGQFIFLTPESNTAFMAHIQFFYPYLNGQEKDLLIQMTEPKVFSVKHKKKILCYLHMDWILSMQVFKETDDIKVRNELIDYLQFETGNAHIEKKISKINGTAKERSNIHTFNQDSVLINLLEPKLSRNTTQLTNPNYQLILNNPLLSFVEIQKGFENKKLNDFLLMVNKSCMKLAKENIILSKMKFGLKLRKIKRTLKNGMYIAETNTLIVDPRHVETFWHELGHWYHKHFKPEIVEKQDCEEFAEFFAKQF